MKIVIPFYSDHNSHMSVYVISDLHGCADEFEKMLDLIRFSNYDELYIIGDVCDRGNDPMRIYRVIMNTPNMHMIMGNHDAWFLQLMDTLFAEKREAGSAYKTMDFYQWLGPNGGFVTADAFLSISWPSCYDLKTWLEVQPMYAQISVMGRSFLLVHAGVGAAPQSGVPVSAVSTHDLLWTHIPVEANPYRDVTMITGHQPTFTYGEEYEGRIITGEKTKTIHIDCGCVFGRTLGCLRLDDMQEFYIPSGYKKLTFH